VSTNASPGRRLFTGGAAASLTAIRTTSVPAAAGPAPERAVVVPTVDDADGAVARLVGGNWRFRHGAATHPHQSASWRREVADGQRPFAIVLSCADARVPPEIVFDQGLGDLFDVRVAGNVLDDLVLGSIEFAVAQWAPPLLVVLGHERCGAVMASIEAVESGATPPAHLDAIVDRLRPVVEPILHEPDAVEAAVVGNVEAVAAQLVADSEVVAGAVGSGALRIVGARYGLDSGEVTLVA
jgi:carbonic anhydrase